MELEKKKCRVVKKHFVGPTIKYHSVSMPLITEIDEDNSDRYSNNSYFTYFDY